MKLRILTAAAKDLTKKWTIMNCKVMGLDMTFWMNTRRPFQEYGDFQKRGRL